MTIYVYGQENLLKSVTYVKVKKKNSNAKSEIM